MDGANALLSLPLSTLLPLAVGYLCYRTAYVGRDGHHKQTDIIFSVVVFAALTRAISDLISPKVAPDAGLLIGAWAAYVTALYWRRYISGWVAEKLRDAGYIDHDGQPTAWKTMLAAQLKGPTRLTVYLKDGRRLMSSRLSDFNDAPLKSCILGEDGSVGIYVTDAYDPETKKWVPQQPFDENFADWGFELTIIPASEVARIEVTRPC
ncbi:hypothetical protein [Paracoccus sp. N5]|uniref:hypothetical protein n=1 Tax=Paracoccus sp. N5 TaxID=1101189 RepID=UPI000382CE4E|nr:hypothetical protein [Paracoccus sp. N5]